MKFLFLIICCLFYTSITATPKLIETKENIVFYINIDSLTGYRSYLILEQIGTTRYITIAGRIQSKKNEVLYYKSSKMELVVKDSTWKFMTDKFVLSRQELNLSQILGTEEVIPDKEMSIPIRYKFTVYYLGELKNNEITLISASDFDDSTSEKPITYKLVE